MKSSGGSPMPKHKLTFKEFEHHTEDAWDAGDDDLIRDAASKISIHSDHAKESANLVLENHSKRSLTSEGHEKGNSKIHSSDSSEKLQQMRFPGGATREVTEDKYLEASEEKIKRDVNNGGYNEVQSISRTASDESTSPVAPPNVQSMRTSMQGVDGKREALKVEKFRKLVDSENTDVDRLKELSWSGIPSTMRPDTWRILCDYMPANKERRAAVLERKRKEYFNFVRDYYDKERQGMHKETFHQIHIDIPRTNPLIPLFQKEIVQEIFERLLFIWAIRHPASGYVQGINDLVTPFFIVFLSEQIEPGADVESYEVSKLSAEVLQNMEADTFWCTTKLLDGIQDNYTFAQPGVQTKVQRLQKLNENIDGELHRHLVNENVEYLQFAFRWMNNLLMREIPLRCTIRLWDTYLAETKGFSDFHLYVCVAFLRQWRKQLLDEKDFQGLMLRLQNVTTSHWGDAEIGLLLAEAFRLRYTYQDAQSHLAAKR